MSRRRKMASSWSVSLDLSTMSSPGSVLSVSTPSKRPRILDELPHHHPPSSEEDESDDDQPPPLRQRRARKRDVLVRSSSVTTVVSTPVRLSSDSGIAGNSTFSNVSRLSIVRVSSYLESTLEEPETTAEKMSRLGPALVELLYTSPRICGDRVVKFMHFWRDEIRDTADSPDWRSYQTLRNRVLKSLPKIFLGIRMQERKSGRYLPPMHNLDNFPRKNYPVGEYDSLWEYASVKIMELYSLHLKKHQGTPKLIDISLDGVQKDKTTQQSVDVYSVRFMDCRTVYTLCAIKVGCSDQDAYDAAFFLCAVLKELRQAGFRIRHFVADAPVLCKIKKMAGHSGFWGCTVCDAKGESCRLDKADCPDKRTKTDGGARVYRSSTMSTATVWTHESIKNVAEDVESGKANTPEECKGIAGKSLLLDFPDFDLARQAVPDAMHLLDMGVVKVLVQFTFRTGTPRATTCKFRRQPTAEVNHALRNLKVPTEMKNPRPVNSAMKSQDYRNAIMFYLFTITKSLDLEMDDKSLTLQVIRVWHVLGYLVRLYRLPRAEFEHISANKIRRIQTLFYQVWQSTFGLRACSYNVHNAAAHLFQVRGPTNDSADLISAYPFEGDYASLRQISPGTDNICYQLLSRKLLQIKGEKNHWCNKKLQPKLKQTARKNNTWFYVFEEGSYKFYQMTAISETPNHIMARRVLTQNIRKDDFPGLIDDIKFEHVGVKKKIGVYGDPIAIPVKEISGKANTDEYCIYSNPNATLMFG